MEVIFFWVFAHILAALFFGWLFYCYAASRKWGAAILGFVLYAIINNIAYYIPALILNAMGITGWVFGGVIMLVWWVLVLVMAGYVERYFSQPATAE